MFILVYRLAMDARTLRGDGGAGGKYPSLLEDFQTGTASMARKRHLASSARGFLLFLSYGLTRPIRLIRLIRGKKTIPRMGASYCRSSFSRKHCGMTFPIG